MSKRGYEAPMDFSYDDGVGPVDAASPFATLARGASSLRPTPSHSFSFGPPAAPRARPNANKPLPREPPTPSASQRIDFTTPRKPRPEIEFDTSGGETPDKAADSEATPDQRPGPRGASMFGSPSRPSAKEHDGAPPRKRVKGKRESFF
ncbi:MAG: hypothetical protein INR71_14235, partial [Terriglobus roseus]|nr:hypothetical protein [Terriglobus roseus]